MLFSKEDKQAAHLPSTDRQRSDSIGRSVFSERELRFTFTICYCPSVCHLSVIGNAHAKNQTLLSLYLDFRQNFGLKSSLKLNFKWKIKVAHCGYTNLLVVFWHSSNYEQQKQAHIQTLKRTHTDKTTHRMPDRCWPPVPSGIYLASHKLDLRKIP